MGQPSASETGGADLLGDAFDDGADGDVPFEEPTAGEMAGDPGAGAPPPPSSPPLKGPTPAEVPAAGGLAVGDRLRCEHFEGNRNVTGEVRELREDGTQALLWIPALGRNWPIRTALVQGGGWTHDAGDYPTIGENEEFDREFRPPVPEQPADPPPAGDDFEPPRRARFGYVWAITRHNVGAAGFDVDGDQRRAWKPNTPGEFRKRDVDGAPRAFRKL